MTRDAQREQRWLWRGIITLVVLAVALFGLTTYSVVQTGRDRAAAAERAERTARNLEVLAESLDHQAGQLDRQAAALERQAQQLEQQAVRAERSREQFRQAARAILEQVGATVEGFDVGTSSTSIEHPTPTPAETDGRCPEKGRGPERCRDGG